MWQLLFLLFFTSTTTLAQQSSLCEQGQLVRIAGIEIRGNKKTNASVILSELGIEANATVCKSQIEEGINRLKRTGLFTSIEFQLSKSANAGADNLELVVIEKWTTIPIFKVNSGGGISQIILGVYDPNVFGEYIELGSQYENLGGASSGVLWFKNPRLNGKRQGIDLQYWNTKRIRIKYDQESTNLEIKRGFLHEREKVYIDYFREILADLKARISFDYNSDSFSTKLLPNEVLNKMGPLAELPPSTRFLISKLGLEYGKIDGDAHSLTGQSVGVYFGYGQSFSEGIDSFTISELNFSYFRTFLPRWQFAQRVQAGITSTKVLQYWYYLGGLDRIRGFADNRFSGKQFVLNNSEIRYLVNKSASTLIQGIAFFDAVAIGDDASAFSKATAASIGTGVRIILPQFYRFVVRLDYAKPIIKNDATNWSFGVQQFF